MAASCDFVKATAGARLRSLGSNVIVLAALFLSIAAQEMSATPDQTGCFYTVSWSAGARAYLLWALSRVTNRGSSAACAAGGFAKLAKNRLSRSRTALASSGVHARNPSPVFIPSLPSATFWRSKG